MSEKTDKDVFSRYFDKELTKDAIAALDRKDVLSFFSPLSFSNPHETKRVILFDTIKEILIRFYNLNEAERGKYIALKDSVFPTPKNGCRNCGKRYLFHGGNCGLFADFFSNSDKYFRVSSENGKIVCIDSIPNWNIAHFFCDYLNKEEETSKMVDWVMDSDFWEGHLKFLLAK